MYGFGCRWVDVELVCTELFIFLVIIDQFRYRLTATQTG